MQVGPRVPRHCIMLQIWRPREAGRAYRQFGSRGGLVLYLYWPVRRWRVARLHSCLGRSWPRIDRPAVYQHKSWTEHEHEVPCGPRWSTALLWSGVQHRSLPTATTFQLHRLVARSPILDPRSWAHVPRRMPRLHLRSTELVRPTPDRPYTATLRSDPRCPHYPTLVAH